MTARLIYEKINLAVPGVEQRRFFNWLNDTINELKILYDNDKHIFVNPDEVSEVTKLDDDVNVFDVYAPAIVDNMLFLAGAGNEYKTEFLRKSELAYKKRKDSSKTNRIMRKMRW